MPTQNDLAALYASSPSLITTLVVIAAVIALILMSWGACFYGTISSCAAHRRHRRAGEEAERRRERVDAFVLRVIASGRGPEMDVEKATVEFEGLRRQSTLSTQATLVAEGEGGVDMRPGAAAGSERKAEVESEVPSSGRRKTELYDSMV